MSQLEDVFHPLQISEKSQSCCDDYDADAELAWLAYILASRQSAAASANSHLRVPAAYQRLAISSDDLRAPFHSAAAPEDAGQFHGYSRSRSDTCLAYEAQDRCARALASHLTANLLDD